VSVLTVSYAGGRTQQISVRRERVAEDQRWLSNYQKLKDSIEEICELNQELLRPDPASPKPGRKRREDGLFVQYLVSAPHPILAQVVDFLRDPMITELQLRAPHLNHGAVYEALGKRHPKSRSRGRRGAPAEMVLRLRKASNLNSRLNRLGSLVLNQSSPRKENCHHFHCLSLGVQSRTLLVTTERANVARKRPDFPCCAAAT
jgi:hypothetical protein